MITADLDRELVASLHSLIARGGLPATAAPLALRGTWRPAPDGAPARYATTLPLELAALAGTDPAAVAAELARPLGAAGWIEDAGSSGGYLMITVTPQALARSAARMAAAGPACATSVILAGTTAVAADWPDLAAARTWQQAWQDQATAMTGRLALAAGASAALSSGRERGSPGPARTQRPRPPAAAAVGYYGPDSVRYALARTAPGSAVPPASLLTPPLPGRRIADPLAAVQQAHADAASVLRWAAALGLARAADEDRLGGQLGRPAERSLLTLLSFLPVTVAAAGRRRRPDELPRYLEDVSSAWQECQRQAPALPFGGAAAPRDPGVAAARLVLADAVRAVLAAGLALTAIAAVSQL